MILLTFNDGDKNKLKNKKLLLIDDDEEIQYVVNLALSSEGYNVLIANNGFEGISILRDNSLLISCIVLDLQMPVMDGSETIKRIRLLDNHKLTPIILSSGQEEVDDEDMKSCQFFLKKPVDLSKLYEVVKKATMNNP